MNSKFVLNKTNVDQYTRPSLTSCMMVIHPVMNPPMFTWNSLQTWCDEHKVSICIIQGNHYYQIGATPTHIIYNNCVEPMKDLSTYFKVYPLYALSHYSLPELQGIATKLQIPLSKTRKQIYEDIRKEIQYKID